MIRIGKNQKPNDLVERIEELSEQSIYSCYQCGTCSSGCPFIQTMDIHPHMVLRHLMFGMNEAVLKSKTIWLCVACFACAERCPRDIDMARIMESLRQEHLRENVDHVNLGHMSAELLESVPQIALVSHFRKNTG
jgi:heterodisulfide reductase subunit C